MTCRGLAPSALVDATKSQRAESGRPGTVYRTAVVEHPLYHSGGVAHVQARVAQRFNDPTAADQDSKPPSFFYLGIVLSIHVTPFAALDAPLRPVLWAPL